MTLPTNIFPQKLKEYLAARECIAFVGAGFSMPCGMPSWSQLIQGLLDEAEKSITTDADRTLLTDSRTALADSRFQTAATGARILLSKEQIRRHVTEAFDAGRLNRVAEEVRIRMLSRMENLVLGPWAGIITTNFDGLIETGFDRFPQLMTPFRCDGSQNALGNVLCLPLGAGGFFVKLHGDTWADSHVLSTDDYVQTWLISPKIRDFLTAVMLRYRIVFIGCSVEDALLQLRLRLWNNYGSALPSAYALLPDSGHNRVRRREMKESAGIESLLYDVSGDGHETVDQFLHEARHCADFQKGDSHQGTLEDLRALPTGDRLLAIGSINRHLIGVVFRQNLHRLKYASILDPDFAQVPQGKSRLVLSPLSESERVYRALFLVSVGILTEVVEDSTTFFRLAPEVVAHLATTMLAEVA